MGGTVHVSTQRITEGGWGKDLVGELKGVHSTPAEEVGWEGGSWKSAEVLAWEQG